MLEGIPPQLVEPGPLSPEDNGEQCRHLDEPLVARGGGRDDLSLHAERSLRASSRGHGHFPHEVLEKVVPIPDNIERQRLADRHDSIHAPHAETCGHLQELIA